MGIKVLDDKMAQTQNYENKIIPCICRLKLKTQTRSLKKMNEISCLELGEQVSYLQSNPYLSIKRFS